MLNRFLFIVLLISLVTVGCDQETEVTSVPQEETLLESVLASQIQAVMAIQDRHTDRLLAISGAVGTATGLTEEGKPAIVVFITTNALAKSAQIPANIEEVPVIIKVTGMFVALTDPTTRQSRPVPIGVSTGHPDITAGTIGARVKDAAGNVFALSNNHVYANINQANIGDSELQPGAFDGGEDPADKIGELFDFEPILFDESLNTIDAAIAISSTNLLGNSTPADDGYGTPNSTLLDLIKVPYPSVQKYGRTTGLTKGDVYAINVTVDVCYKARGPYRCNSNFIARFVDQIAITPGSFSSGGDSGSLIVTDDANKNPVGLLFAGSSTHTLANPIGLVLTKFGVTIDDSEPVAPGAADPATSTITASPTSITADGTSASTVTVQLKDADGNSLTSGGDVVALSTDPGTIGAVTYNGDGTYSATLTAGTTAGTATVTGTLNGAPITDTATVTFTEPAAGVNVTSIVPNSMQSGTMIVVTISGSGFAAGTEVTFENGSGPAPATSNVVFVDANTITGTVTAKSGGPPGRNRVWDVRVTNPDGSSGVLVDGFTVTP